MGESILGIETKRKVDAQKNFDRGLFYFHVEDYSLRWMGECATRIRLNRDFFTILLHSFLRRRVFIYNSRN